jgi:hypothetical protein
MLDGCGFQTGVQIQRSARVRSREGGNGLMPGHFPAMLQPSLDGLPRHGRRRLAGTLSLFAQIAIDLIRERQMRRLKALQENRGGQVPPPGRHGPKEKQHPRRQDPKVSPSSGAGGIAAGEPCQRHNRRRYRFDARKQRKDSKKAGPPAWLPHCLPQQEQHARGESHGGLVFLVLPI